MKSDAYYHNTLHIVIIRFPFEPIDRMYLNTYYSMHYIHLGGYLKTKSVLIERTRFEIVCIRSQLKHLLLQKKHLKLKQMLVWILSCCVFHYYNSRCRTVARYCIDSAWCK